MRTKGKELEPVPHAVFICEGEYWTLASEGRLIRLRDSKGLRQLALLLHEPGREFHVLDLGARIDPREIDSGVSRTDPEQLAQLTVRSTLNGDNGEFLDAQARAAYKQRLVELTEELEEARRFRDEGRVARIEGEKHLVMRELEAAFGLSGRIRKAGSAAEQARVNVTKNIGRALEQIEAKHESLGRFLKSTIKTGIFCSYQPDPRFPVAWSFEAEQSAQTISSTEHGQPSVGSAPDLYPELVQPAGRGEAQLAQKLGAPPTASQLEHLGRQTAAAAAKKSDGLQIRLADTFAPENVEGERKTVTALLADFKGSIGLIEDLDPEELRAIVDPALKLMINAVHHYDGYVTRTTDDGIFALFGAPVAHEDHPQRALSAALRMQAKVKRYAEKLRAEKGLNMQVRVGANTGEVVVREIRIGEKHTEYGPIGHSISVAASVQMLVAPGSIAITESVRKLVEGFFTLKLLGPARIRGVSEPLQIYEVTGPGLLRTRCQRAAARGYTRFVGRRREMEMMENAAESAMMGRGQMVATVGEPGVGKSRLLSEFKATSQKGWLVLEGVSFSHGKTTAYLPLVELLQDYFAIEPDDEPWRRREKVAGKVTTLDRSLEETLPHLFGLLGIIEGTDPLAGMDEQIRRRRTQEAVKRILLHESLNQPLMLIFEDLHLIDDATQGFLNLLTEGIASASVLLLVNYRPEYTHQWSSKTYYTHLRLDPLGKDSAAEMLSARIGDSPDLAPVKRLILERTEGNPLFIEELVEALFDEGVLVRNGTVRVTRPLSQLKLPPIVQGILAARIDRLPPDAKELLQTLAVIGSQFPLALVRQVVKLPADRLDPPLDVLQAGEFIYERPATGDVEYTFKHALTHDAAYNSLLTERRKLLHERTAQAIEVVYSQRLEDHYAELAYHYRSSDNAAKAVEYLCLAGEQAIDRGSYSQALANVEPALRLIGRLPKGEERLRAELGVRLMEGRTASVLHGLGSGERLRAFQRVCELSEQLGDDSTLFMRLVGGVHAGRADARRAQEVLNRCLGPAEIDKDREIPPYVQQLVGWCAYGSGELLKASSQFAELMAASVSARRRGPPGIVVDPWVLAPAILGLVQVALGRPDEAVRLSEEAIRRARQLNQPFMLAQTLWNVAGLHFHLRDPEATSELADEIITLAEQYGFREWLAQGHLLRGWAMRELDQTDPGLAQLEAGSSPKTTLFFPSEMFLETVFVRTGRADEALELIGKALARVESTGAYIGAPELYRFMARALLIRDPSATAEAEKCFRKAVEIARGQSAKWWELRATTGLARLLRDTNRREEARTVLSEIYNWFTEGFDTADLKDARVLLDELN
jgi:class 3 adenylate cyclase/tetratricopeptide (TPR) repeat protein